MGDKETVLARFLPHRRRRRAEAADVSGIPASYFPVGGRSSRHQPTPDVGATGPVWRQGFRGRRRCRATLDT